MKRCPTCQAEFFGDERFCPIDGSALAQVAMRDDREEEGWLDREFERLDSLGRDELGEVFVALDRSTGLKIAVKEFNSWVRKTDAAVKSYQAILDLLKTNPIDGIPLLITYRMSTEEAFIASELIEDFTTLEGFLKTRETASVREAIDLVQGILTILSELHELGVVHGGLTTRKILLTNGLDPGGLYLTDPGQFGLWRVDNPILISRRNPDRYLGSAPYYSPEAAQGKSVQPQSDLYTVGIILYELLAGKPPFLAKSFATTLKRQIFERPLPPRLVRPGLVLPNELEAILDACLAKDPAARFESANALRNALGNIDVSHAVQATAPDSPVRRPVSAPGIADDTDSHTTVMIPMARIPTQIDEEEMESRFRPSTDVGEDGGAPPVRLPTRDELLQESFNELLRSLEQENGGAPTGFVGEASAAMPGSSADTLAEDLAAEGAAVATVVDTPVADLDAQTFLNTIETERTAPTDLVMSSSEVEQVAEAALVAAVEAFAEAETATGARAREARDERALMQTEGTESAAVPSADVRSEQVTKPARGSGSADTPFPSSAGPTVKLPAAPASTKALRRKKGGKGAKATTTSTSAPVEEVATVGKPTAGPAEEPGSPAEAFPRLSLEALRQKLQVESKRVEGAGAFPALLPRTQETERNVSAGDEAQSGQLEPQASTVAAVGVAVTPPGQAKAGASGFVEVAGAGTAQERVEIFVPGGHAVATPRTPHDRIEPDASRDAWAAGSPDDDTHQADLNFEEGEREDLAGWFSSDSTRLPADDSQEVPFVDPGRWRRRVILPLAVAGVVVLVLMIALFSGRHSEQPSPDASAESSRPAASEMARDQADRTLPARTEETPASSSGIQTVPVAAMAQVPEQSPERLTAGDGIILVAVPTGADGEALAGSDASGGEARSDTPTDRTDGVTRPVVQTGVVQEAGQDDAQTPDRVEMARLDEPAARTRSEEEPDTGQGRREVARLQHDSAVSRPVEEPEERDETAGSGERGQGVEAASSTAATNAVEDVIAALPSEEGEPEVSVQDQPEPEPGDTGSEAGTATAAFAEQPATGAEIQPVRDEEPDSEAAALPTEPEPADENHGGASQVALMEPVLEERVAEVEATGPAAGVEAQDAPAPAPGSDQTESGSAAAEISDPIRHSRVLTRQAEEALQGTNYNLAEELFTEALELDDRNARAHAGLGDVYFQRQDFSAARRSHRRAISFARNNASYYSRLGMDYFRLGSYLEAIRSWERALELDPDESNAQRYIEIARERLQE